MPLVPDILNLDLAWLRVKNDLAGRVFVAPPFDKDLVFVDAPAWIGQIATSLNTAAYSPSSMIVVDVPKSGGGIRPGAYLSLRDQVVYAAAVGACFPAIASRVASHEGVIDYSRPLSRNSNAVLWLTHAFGSWTAFRKASIEKLAAGPPFMVSADITSFYDNIDIAILMSDLRSCGCSPEAIDLLSRCLNRWAMVGGRGIPQGHSASDVLQKLYLHSVDASLKNSAYSHVRYVDDIRVFCRTKASALRAILDLASLLRVRGLQLQTAKTRVYIAADARTHVEGIAPVIEGVRQQFIARARSALGYGLDYLSVGDADRLLSGSPDDAPLEVVRDAYQANFVDSDRPAFDRSLFHFLLNRLARHADAFAAVHSLGLLSTHPEETAAILDYADGANAHAEADTAIVALLTATDAVYAYQAYQALNWVMGTGHQPSREMLALIRDRALRSGIEWYVATVARCLLGCWGEPADLEGLERLYGEVADPIEKARILCALTRQEPGRRNAFLSRAQTDGDWQQRGAQIAKRGVPRSSVEPRS